VSLLQPARQQATASRTQHVDSEKTDNFIVSSFLSYALARKPSVGFGVAGVRPDESHNPAEDSPAQKDIGGCYSGSVAVLSERCDNGWSKVNTQQKEKACQSVTSS
jgi:hypothetical protein